MPLAGPPGFRAVQAAERRDHDAIEFTVLRGGVPATETVAGAKCYQVYVPAEGAVAAGVPDLLARYRGDVERAGAQVVFADRHNLHARLSAAGRETWFRINVQDHEVDVTVLERRALQATLTRPSRRDHRQLGHMPHYREASADTQADAERDFTVRGRDGRRSIAVRGALHEIVYHAVSHDRLSSDLEIQENYRIALRARGADILDTDWRTTVARMMDRERVVWVRVASQVSDISVLTVTVPLPPPSKRPGDAAVRRALADAGRAVVASGLAIGAEQPAALVRGVAGQIARLMRRDRTLVLAVVAHTDDVGDADALRLRSQMLAEAIVNAAVREGIARGRFNASGAGAERPAADNASEEGRAANRRVELVRTAAGLQ